MDYLLDTNVLIEILRGNVAVTNLVNSLPTYIDATAYAECLQGMKSNVEKRRTKKFLDSFALIHYTPEVSQRAIDLIEKYSNSHNLLLPDSLVAACAIEYDLILLTYNKKDFQYIADLTMQLPPPKI